MRVRGQFSEGFFEKALQNIHEGVYIVDPARMVLFWNRGAERLSGYTTKEIVGRHCFDDILQHVDASGQRLCLTACPLAKTLIDGELREAEIYLRHRAGHRVPVRVTIAPIRDADGAVIAAVETFSEIRAGSEILERVAELEKLAMGDALTGLANRRYLDIRLESRLAELDRYGWTFGAAILDIDDFKKINDTHGHDVGDQVLKTTSATILSNLLPFDDSGRWGGEEFLVLAANVSGKLLFSLLDRLRSLIAASSVIAGERTISVTVSIGAAEARPGDDRAGILKRADEALYASKRSGKNRVVLA